MRYYDTCPKCGANLDPGESCDCEKRATAPDRPHYVETVKTTAGTFRRYSDGRLI